MNFALLGLSLASVFALGQCLTACKDLPKVRHDATKTLAPYGEQWRIVRSNAPNDMDKCTSFEYIGKRNGKNNYATGLFIQRKKTADMDVHTDYMVRVDNDCDQWRANPMDPANPMNDLKFRKLWIDYKAEAFCIYICDDDEIKTKYYSCMTTNAKGVDAIKKAEQTWTMDLSAEVKDVWDETCENDRVPKLPMNPIGTMTEGLCTRNGDKDDENIAVNGKTDPKVKEGTD